MVESKELDTIFTALADATRRDILSQVSKAELSISEIAQKYKLTLAAVSKHIQFLERAQLVAKRRRGKEVLVFVVPTTMHIAQACLEQYAQSKEQAFTKLDVLLKEL